MVKIHSVIYIVSFLLFVSVLAFPSPPVLLLSGLLLTLLYWLNGRDHLPAALRMLRRMRWFLLSILVVYGWLTPGEALIQWSALPPSWSPTYEGLLSGLQRVVALTMVIASVSLLLSTLSRPQLLGAIWLLARPLEIIGIKPEMIALRMILVMDAMSEVQTLMSHHLPQKGQAPRRLDKVGELAAGIFSAVTARAKQSEQHDIVLPSVERPPLIQWTLPLLLWSSFYLIKLWWPPY